MDLPISDKELDTIVKALGFGGDIALYQKLWTYKMNYLIKQTKKEDKE